MGKNYRYSLMGHTRVKSTRRKRRKSASDKFWEEEFYSPPVFIGKQPIKKRKIPYKEKLKDPRWKKKRGIIFKRDNYTCQKCGSKTNLQVHHKKYTWGKDPWNYPNKQLITLCGDCHKKEHLPEINARGGDKGLDEELDERLKREL